MSSFKVKSIFFMAICVLLIMILPYGNNILAAPTLPQTRGVSGDDLDPLVDLNITIDFLYIRGLDPTYQQALPDFFMKLWINGDLFVSPMWNDTLRVYNPWNVTYNIPDDKDNVSILIELWNNQDGSPCSAT